MTDNWLTPETAIGARLPCGAAVERARWYCDKIVVDFDRDPVGVVAARFNRSFDANGTHVHGDLPNLIPPTPAQPGVFVTREAWQSAIKNLDAEWTFRDLERALGIPPDPPKVAPWEVAYEARYAVAGAASPDPRTTWKAAVEWCVGHIDDVAAPTCNSAKLEALLEIRRRIMGDTK